MMTLHSMTGYARVSKTMTPYQWVWDLRSVNGRGLDIRLRLPFGWEHLDPLLRKKLSQKLKRGSLQVHLDLRKVDGTQQLEINTQLLDKLIAVCEARGENPRIDQLLNIRGVLEQSEESSADEEILKSHLFDTFDEAIEAFIKHRLDEGQQIKVVLLDQVKQLESLIKKAIELDSTQLTAIQAKFAKQVEELKGQKESFDDQRIAQEVALLAVKADIREELDRLQVHVRSAFDFIQKGGAVGRKLDFLCQEFNREANTLCSKSSDIQLTNIGLELKATIDQLREQSANIE